MKVPCENCLKINWMSDCSIMMDWMLKGPDIATRFHWARVKMGEPEEKRISGKILMGLGHKIPYYQYPPEKEIDK